MATKPDFEKQLQEEKVCQEGVARRILGDEDYENSPCQAHPLQFIEEFTKELKKELKVEIVSLKKQLFELREFLDAPVRFGVCETCVEKSLLMVDDLQKEIAALRERAEKAEARVRELEGYLKNCSNRPPCPECNKWAEKLQRSSNSCHDLRLQIGRAHRRTQLWMNKAKNTGPCPLCAEKDAEILRLNAATKTLADRIDKLIEEKIELEEKNDRLREELAETPSPCTRCPEYISRGKCRTLKEHGSCPAWVLFVRIGVLAKKGE